MIPFMEVARKIENAIVRGDYPVTLPRINELCELYQMGPSTIKRALGRLKELEFIKGFQGKCISVNPDACKNPYFRKNVAVFVEMGKLGNPFYLRVLNYLSSHFAGINCRMTLVNSIRQLREFQSDLDAAILIEVAGKDEMAEMEAICGKEKILLLNTDIHDYHFVGSDNRAAGFMAMEYLHGQLGHRKIGVIGSELDRSFDLLRLEGAQDYGKMHADLEIIACEAKAFGNAKECTEALLSSHNDITALFLLRDFFALGVYSYCQENHLSIPGRVSVLGFDNRDFSSMLYPALDTFQEDTAEIARVTFDQTLKIIRQESPEQSSYIIRPLLITRNSGSGRS